MAKAIHLAEKGLYTCDPNPRVGCVLVKDGIIIGQGWHAKAGEAHAEVAALASAKANNPSLIEGCTAYVSLEPCSHTGKTPPCVEAIIESKIATVVIGMIDPNPLVSGQGIKILEGAGIEVISPILEEQAKALNPGFNKRMQQSKPFVRLKMASSLDGKTALSNGESEWITSEAARKDVHHWRARSSAILTGIETVLSDNPSLNARLDNEDVNQPLRVVVDSALRTPLTSKIFSNEGETLIATIDTTQFQKVAKLRSSTSEVIQLKGTENLRVDLHALMSVLGEAEINEVMVECGSTLAGSLLEAELVDEIVFYMAPKLMGGASQNLFTLPEFKKMNECLNLSITDMRQVGDDIRIIAKPNYA